MELLLNKICSTDQIFFMTFWFQVSKVKFWYRFGSFWSFSISSSPIFTFIFCFQVPKGIGGTPFPPWTGVWGESGTIFWWSRNLTDFWFQAVVMVIESMHEKTEEAMCKLLQALFRSFIISIEQMKNVSCPEYITFFRHFLLFLYCPIFSILTYF